MIKATVFSPSLKSAPLAK